MSKVLECHVFEGNSPLTGDLIWQHRVSGGSVGVKDKMKSHYKWDGTTNVAAVSAGLKDGDLDTWNLHLFGKSKGVKLASSTFFTEQEESTHIRIQPMNLDKLVFHSMVSDWLKPEDYSWEYRLPSENDANRHYRIKDADLPHYNLKPLWIRANAQMVPGPKLQIFIGGAPANQISELPGSKDRAFPLIPIEKFSVSFLPLDVADENLGMATIPFLDDDRDDLEEAEVSANCPDGQEIKRGLATFLQSSIKPNQRNEVTTWTREVSSGSWIPREPNYKVPDPRPLEGEDDANDQDNEDDAGQDNTVIQGGPQYRCFIASLDYLGGNHMDYVYHRVIKHNPGHLVVKT